MHHYYENTEDIPIETVFYFPVDPDLAVSGILVDFGTGKIIEARVYER